MMTTNEDIINYTIKPHGGELINRVVEGKDREALIEKANAFKSFRNYLCDYCISYYYYYS